MEGLFIIPTLVSPNINPRLVPAFSKLIERNILITGGATFRAAVLKKYSGFLKTVRNESTLTEQKDKNEDEYGDTYDPAGYVVKKGEEAISSMLKHTTGTAEKQRTQPSLTEPEKIEIPQGISFFHTIGLEPTILEIPITIKKHVIGISSSERIIRIGVKCIPYTIDGVENVINAMKTPRNKNTIDKSLRSKLKAMRRRFQDYSMTGTPMDIFAAPTSEELSNPSKLARMMSAREPSTWSSLVILSTEDFGDMDLRESLLNYKNLVKTGWGDMIIYNVAKDSVHFCTTRMNACLEMPMAYVKQILNLTNVLSYAEIARWSRPFGVSSLGKALSDNTIVDFKSEDTEAKILEIIRE
jgi:hypothetical protein